MADEDSRNDGPSLELPSMRFRRKRRRKAREPEPVDDTAPLTAVPEAPRTEEPAAPRAAAAEPAPQSTFVDEAVAHPDATDQEVEAPTPTRRARRARRPLTRIGGLAAAVLTGLLVGVITVGLTWASLRLCEVARGTSSCGGPGFLLLLAIMVAMVFLGSLLLRATGVAEPGSTSFLAIGLLAVLVLLFLVDVLFAWWMIIVIPVFSVLTFALAHWVTTAFIEPADR